MGTTAQKLNKLLTTKADIKAAIEDKGVTVPSNATFASYATYISNISGGGSSVSGNIELQQQTGTDVSTYETASVKSGVAGTPTATKGSVSNHQITVTPSVTNTAGWVNSETKTGTGVVVSASELVSGNQAITASTTTQSNIDVTNNATVSVTPTPSETKTATANGDVTPSSGKLLSKVTVNINYKTFRTGSGAPSNSLGNDGDVYFDIS